MKDKKRWIVLLIYLTLLLSCFFIVKLVDQLASPKKGETQESPVLPETSPQETERRVTPSDAERETTEWEDPEQYIAEDGNRSHFWKFYGDKKETITQETEEISKLPEETKPQLMIASDLHYYPPELTDYQTAFTVMAQKDDGKVTKYSSELLDAFFDEAARRRPTALILSGDITLNGEKEAHIGLSKKLDDLENLGVPVLVIPGNHDINNTDAASYFEEEEMPESSVTAAEFREIYGAFGYDEAVSEDTASLSYVYQLDPYNRLLMLDSCQYDPVNLVGGVIRPETLLWMEEQFEEAKVLGMSVIPVAHHNLLKESILYPDDCTLENSGEVIALLEKYRVPVYISGHLHLQRIKRYKSEPGESEELYHIYEIVSDSLSISPNQFGSLVWEEDGELSYRTETVDVSAWAASNGYTDENLLDFKTYSLNYLEEEVASQIYSQMSNFPEYHMEAMAVLYGELNSTYCAGLPIEREEIRTSAPFQLWERNLPDSKMFFEMEDILKDTRKNHNTWRGPLVIPE